MKYPARPLASAGAHCRSDVVTTSLSIPDTGLSVVLTRVMWAVRANGIGHHSDNANAPPGSGVVANISDCMALPPNPAPKNSPSGESTMVRPSNSICSRNPFSS